MNISPTVYRPRLTLARGSVAIELAVILMALIFILPGMFVYGYFFLQYNVAKNASNGAARYLAASGQWNGLSASARREAATAMAERLAAEGGMRTGEDDLSIIARCGEPRATCTGDSFETVTVEIDWRLEGLGILGDQEWMGLRSIIVNPKTNRAP